MKLQLFSPRKKIANIVISDYIIRFIELKQTNPITIQKSGERIIPEGLIVNGRIKDFETLSIILEECVAEWGIAKYFVRFIVPDPFIVIRKIDIPIDIKDDELMGYLFIELGASVHLPFEDPVFDLVTLSKTEEKREILLFAAPEEVVTEYKELFEEVKLKPLAADISSLCMYRLFYYFHQQLSEEIGRTGGILSIRFDMKSVSVSIFEEHKPIFMRHLPIDLSFTRIEKSKTGKLIFTEDNQTVLSHLEEIFNEIEKVIHFYQFSLHKGQMQIERIVLTGDHRLLIDIHDIIESRFDIMVSFVQQYSNNEQIELPPTPYDLALGLALKEVR